MRTERGLGRLVGFADGVVAIAITLLVLPLVDDASGMTGGVLEFIQENPQQLLVFVISFLVIGRFWMLHHALYENVIDYSHSLLWWNLLWLLTIVFLPFPTELLATDSSADGITHGVYVGTMFLTTVASSVQTKIIIDHPEMQAEQIRGTLRLQPSLIAMSLLFVAAVVAVLLPGPGLLALLLLLISGPISAVINRVRARR